ncbi:hypothetical protein SMD11_6168 [Streptomyces albireticuli]|uniref:Uncharacterized protein n=1 Tax=Streptomyces albireticuli TaxID=1940 RepID=A0A1Z2LBR5_9ACTN|nr:hypothetical protein SMD11_6168 [Streptomyces albireticuli]
MLKAGLHATGTWSGGEGVIGVYEVTREEPAALQCW